MNVPKITKIGCVLLCSLFLASCSDDSEHSSPQESARIVKTIMVGDEIGAKPRQYPGKVQANQSVDLAFQVGGQVIEIPVTRGQEVNQGELLAKLDARDYENQYEVTKAQLEQAQLKFNRTQELLESNTVSQSEYDNAKAALDIAKAQAQIAKKAVDDTQLFAPFAGRIAEKYIENYQNVQAKQQVISLQAIDHIDIVVYLPEQDMAFAKRENKIKAKDTVEFSAIAGREYEVELKEFSTQADEDTQTYKVVLTMQAPTDVNILPGMTATFILRTRFTEQDTSFNIPSQSVATDTQGQYYVWVVDEQMTARKRVVEVGELTQGDIQVLKGLSPGERIIVAGVTLVTEGMPVKLYNS